MKEIDLSKILNDTIINKDDVIVNLAGKVAIKEAMKRSIYQALDMASEEATIWVESDINGTEFKEAHFDHDGYFEKVTVHKDSILNIKSKIK